MTTATEQLPHKEQFPYVPFGLERGHLSAIMMLTYKSRLARIREAGINYILSLPIQKLRL